ncbi:MAG TPA: sigma-70 family RNA polymerase sigma factor [Bryobacteraceae bacterium]|nr:sigma-70 family RNA polymerase sigma factor [Bryobacteraceae bacterium]
MHQQEKEHETLHCQSDAINELFAQHYKASLRTAYRILRSKEDSEDAVQTAYCAAFQNFRAFRSESSFNTWITRIVVNCCLTQLRQRRSQPQVPLDDVQRSFPVLNSQAVTPETLCYLVELQAAHRHAVSRLPQDLHDVYAPCVLADAAFATVCRHLGLTTGAAKSRLFRARKKVEHTLRPVTQPRAA